MPRPPWGRTELYGSVDELHDRFAPVVRDADLVIVGSYVPQGDLVGDWVQREARGRTAFYDIDTPVTFFLGSCRMVTPRPFRNPNMVSPLTSVDGRHCGSAARSPQRPAALHSTRPLHQMALITAVSTRFARDSGNSTF
ncbi:MAG: hypothetical protein ACXWC6_05575, partial [Ramlibacter sp.]